METEIINLGLARLLKKKKEKAATKNTKEQQEADRKAHNEKVLREYKIKTGESV
jgi:hypothetical protein